LGLVSRWPRSKKSKKQVLLSADEVEARLRSWASYGFVRVANNKDVAGMVPVDAIVVLSPPSDDPERRCEVVLDDEDKPLKDKPEEAQVTEAEDAEVAIEAEPTEGKKAAAGEACVGSSPPPHDEEQPTQRAQADDAEPSERLAAAAAAAAPSENANGRSACRAA
jgi:hypothetical protein